jgi:L-rhamnose mutarotase
MTRSLSQPMNNGFCPTPDLKEGAESIAEYQRDHQKIWPEITKSIKDSAVVDLDIHRFGTRMFTVPGGTRARLFRGPRESQPREPQGPGMGGADGQVLEGAPNAKLGEKWLPVERTFKLEA